MGGGGEEEIVRPETGDDDGGWILACIRLRENLGGAG